MAFDPREYLRPNPINRDTSAFDALAQSGMLQTMADRASGERSAASDRSAMAQTLAQNMGLLDVEGLKGQNRLQEIIAGKGVFPQSTASDFGYDPTGLTNLSKQMQNIDALAGLTGAAEQGIQPMIPFGTPTDRISKMFHYGLPSPAVQAAAASSKTTDAAGREEKFYVGPGGNRIPGASAVTESTDASITDTRKGGSGMTPEAHLRARGWATVEVDGQRYIGKLSEDGLSVYQDTLILIE